MAFHMVCGMWHDSWGLVISEPFHVTGSGGEPFAKVPRALLVKE
jgi:hypothetical protein